MDKRLKELQKTLQTNEFKDLNFTDKMKRSVMEELERNVLSEEGLLEVVLHLLSSEKTGFELTNRLRSRGIDNFENENGSIYMYLHEWEQKGWIVSTWKEERKYYAITKKGVKLLEKQEQRSSSTKTVFKELFEG